MTLREALEIGNGAVYKSSLVQFVEEQDSNRPWNYVPDMDSAIPCFYSLTDAQLDQLVLFANCHGWMPVNNFIW